MQAHETPLAAAVARASEEMGPFPASNTVHAHTLHRGEGVHTITGDADAPFEPRFTNPDMEHGWFTAPEVDELPLHPGFRESWDVLKPKSPAFAGLSAESRLTSGSPSMEGTSWKFTSTGTTSLSDSAKVADWRFGVKVAQFQTMYHFAPKGARGDIERNGIDSSKGQMMVGRKPLKSRGNYLWESREAADQLFAPSLHDLWKVDARDLPLRPDPERIGGAWVTDQPIGADRVQRISTDEAPPSANVLPAEVNNWGEDPQLHATQFANDFKGT
jgi:hypothetical protein